MDHVSNFIASIKNACSASNEVVTTQASKVLLAISDVLRQEGLLEGIKVIKKQSNKLFLCVQPTFVRPGLAKIREIKRVSKPGLRRYWSCHEIKANKLRTHGTFVVSTSQGVMVDREAMKRNIGGEVICKVVKR